MRTGPNGEQQQQQLKVLASRLLRPLAADPFFHFPNSMACHLLISHRRLPKRKLEPPKEVISGAAATRTAQLARLRREVGVCASVRVSAPRPRPSFGKLQIFLPSTRASHLHLNCSLTPFCPRRSLKPTSPTGPLATRRAKGFWAPKLLCKHTQARRAVSLSLCSPLIGRLLCKSNNKIHC